MDSRDAKWCFESLRQRIGALSATLPLTFSATAEKERERFLQDVAELKGYSEDEVGAEEASLNVAFPEVFRQYLLTMGKRRGPLFLAHDFAGVGWFTYYRKDAEMKLVENSSCRLPANAVVFLRDPYEFCFIEATGGFDSPVWSYNPDDDSFYEVSPSYWKFLDDELRSVESKPWDVRGLVVQVTDNNVSVATSSFPTDDSDH
jgi:SUKH superfamily protein